VSTEATPDLDAALARHFGHDSFREGQREVISSVLAGRPTLVVMPTGAGKSLCFQLPALLLPGVTLVVSPLIALMKDQVDALRARGIAATFVNSSLGERERQSRSAAMAAGEYKLVYLAPERFRSPRFVAVLRRTPVSLFAVDEAHCISQWGHDFRPDYARLGEARTHLQAPCTLALTATATRDVRNDICRALRLDAPAIFVAGFDRPNLHLEVIRVRSLREKVEAAAALAHEGGSGIVYAATRKSAERMAGELGARGLQALCYHGGLPDSERRGAQEAFMQARSAVVAATSAFGLGVDKPDIRFVVHAEVPRSLETYYQEIGRAGRDGAPAVARLLFNHADVFLLQRMIRDGRPSPVLLRDLWALLLKLGTSELTPSLLAARLGAHEASVAAALRLLEGAGYVERAAPARPRVGVELLGGMPSNRAHAQRALLEAIRAELAGQAEGEVEVEALATRSGQSVEGARRTLAALEEAGLLFFRTVGPAPREFRVAPAASGAGRLRVDDRLLKWQLGHELALLRGVTRYAYARCCRRHLLLSYFGENAPRRCNGCDNCALRAGKPARAGSPRPLDTRLASYELFQSGFSVEQVAAERGLGTETIRGHLAAMLEAGRPLDLARIVSPARVELILEAARRAPPFIEAIKRALPPDFLFGEIHLVLVARRAGRISEPAPESEQRAGSAAPSASPAPGSPPT
jgi:ATP-dependent DNA helicase RecQ